MSEVNTLGVAWDTFVFSCVWVQDYILESVSFCFVDV